MLLVLMAGCAGLPAAGPASELADAERAFAALSMRTHMAHAFVATFADDGVMLADGWTTAKAAFGGRPPPPVRLDWGPSLVEVAASGELGLSTGPWIRSSIANPEAPPAHGHFVSVWRRSAQGRWQVEVDFGIAHPEAMPIPAAAASVPPSPITGGPAPVEEAEAAFVKMSLAEGARAAYAAFALPRLRLYREGHVPYLGRGAALAAPQLETSRLLWLTDARATARSEDFAYVRGTYTDAAQPARVSGHFLRVWRREGDRWGIALDITRRAR
jgi:ketosteroid isomerase-like protein